MAQKAGLFGRIKSPFFWLADFVYPPVCVLCKKIIPAGSPVCEACLSKMQPYPQIESANQLWIARQGDSSVYLECFLAGFSFEPNLQQLIHLLKYQNEKRLGVLLGKRLAGQCSKPLKKWKIDWVVPVPLHPKKKRTRGYNQSELVGAGLAGLLNLTFKKDVLFRTRNTPSNTKLSAPERVENVAGAFAVAAGINPAGKNILLIDDVITTGSTLNACAEPLKKAGARTLYALALAHPDA